MPGGVRRPKKSDIVQLFIFRPPPVREWNSPFPSAQLSSREALLESVTRQGVTNAFPRRHTLGPVGYGKCYIEEGEQPGKRGSLPETRQERDARRPIGGIGDSSPTPEPHED